MNLINKLFSQILQIILILPYTFAFIEGCIYNKVNNNAIHIVNGICIDDKDCDKSTHFSVINECPNQPENIKCCVRKDETDGECKFINSLMGVEEYYNCCDIDGIGCFTDIETGLTHIDYIGDKSKNFKYINNSTLPKSFGSMPYLEELRISGKKLNGTIPEDIGNLKSLKSLILNDNYLSGGIPPEIGKCSNLEEIILHDNFSLNGTISPEIGKLSKLEYIDFSFTNLRGSIPSEIGELTSLLKLDLSFSGLSGSIPSSIGNLTKLYHLKIAHNYLKGFIPHSISNLINLNVLDLSYNQLEGTIPSLGRLKKLTKLGLSNNKLYGEFIFKDLEKLSFDMIDLSSNSDLTGKIPYINLYSYNAYCHFEGTKLCYSKDEKNPKCHYTKYYNCSSCQDISISTIIDGVCKCNEGYSGAGYIKCIKDTHNNDFNTNGSERIKYFPSQYTICAFTLMTLMIEWYIHNMH